MFSFKFVFFLLLLSVKVLDSVLGLAPPQLGLNRLQMVITLVISATKIYMVAVFTIAMVLPLTHILPVAVLATVLVKSWFRTEINVFNFVKMMTDVSNHR